MLYAPFFEFVDYIIIREGLFENREEPAVFSRTEKSSSITVVINTLRNLRIKRIIRVLIIVVVVGDEVTCRKIFLLTETSSFVGLHLSLRRHG